MVQFREVNEHDWSGIAWLASGAVQDGDHGGWETHWVEQRRTFKGVQQQGVAEAEGEIVGYCGIERGPEEPEGAFRVFLVADWDERNSHLHELLLGKVEEMLKQQRAQQAWMRELTGDVRLVKFVRRYGFEISKEYAWGGRGMVNLTKALGYAEGQGS